MYTQYNILKHKKEGEYLAQKLKSVVFVNDIPIEQLSEEELEKFQINMMQKFKERFGLQIPKFPEK